MVAEPARPDRSAPGVRMPPDPATLELLRVLLTLSPADVRQVLDETPRRRSRRPQRGPELVLGAED